MRILLISDHADPLAKIGSKEAGGQNIYVYHLARYLSALGVSVDIYTRWDNKDKHQVVQTNNKVRVIRVKAGPKRYIPRDDLLNHIEAFTASLLERIKDEQLSYSLIHTNYWFSGLIGLSLMDTLNSPMVHVYHSIGKVRYNALRKHKSQDAKYSFYQERLKAEQRIADQCSHLIATSPIEKRLIQRHFSVPSSKITSIPIGVDTQLFHPLSTSQARLLIQAPQNNRLLLYVGRIEWRKGIGTLLYAMKELLRTYPSLKLYIIGGGTTKKSSALDNNELTRLRSIASQLGIQRSVQFLGPKPQKVLYRYYSAADVCVVPSYYEPFGIVPLESMACGTPVVASQVGGLQYTVRDKVTGYLAEPRDYHDLSEKISSALIRTKDSFSNHCIDHIQKNFLWQSIAETYLKMFKTLIHNKG